ncbi:uncharacterized protein LOC124269967 [Haliotis rubra]|uniref:uncharacterized protein LOC124269967 n=1 Tax=Haliotis rubra TaxID=36100 RepID=UPI001EE5B205|nr:uncharacterized protein LOC124269967 [Haliotis rubra]
MDQQGAECDVCGGGHETEVCPELGLEEAAPGTSNETKARLTVPSSLLVQTYTDGSVGIYTRENLPSKTQFGPFEARRTTHEIGNEDLFVLKILSKEKDGSAVCLDASDENECNWMCLVEVARTEEEQNCMAYQLATNIFFNTTKAVEAGSPLKVWYASHYAKKMGKSPQPDGSTISMLGQKLTVQEESVLATPSPSSRRSVRTRVLPARSKSHTNEKGDMGQNDAIENFFSEVKQSLDEREEADEDEDGEPASADYLGIYGFKCQRCSKSFEDQSQLAYHIREHIMPTVEKKTFKGVYTCKICKVGFQTVSNYNRHMKRHVGYKVKCPQCNYYTYRPDILQTHLMGQHGVTLENAKTLAASSELPANGDEGSRKTSGRKGRRRRRREGKGRLKVRMEDVVEPGEEGEEEAEESTLKSPVAVSPRAVSSHDAAGFSPTRVQPRRSLKGIRTTGNLKGINPTSLFKKRKNESESEEEESPAKSPVKILIPEVKKKRGRPRKHPVVEPVVEAVSPMRRRGRPRKDAEEVHKVAEEAMEEEEEENAEPGEIMINDPAESGVKGEKVEEVASQDVKSEIVPGEEKSAVTAETFVDETKALVEPEPPTESEIPAESEAPVESEPVKDEAERTLPTGDENVEEDKANIADDAEEKTEENQEEEPDQAKEEVIKPVPKRRGRPPKHGRVRNNEEMKELEKQIRQVGNAFQCGVCEKKFSQKKYVMLHLPKHTTKFKCDGCEKQFARYESYQNHSCVHHPVSDDIITTDKNGCYSCGECGKVFSKPEYVKRHYSVHSSSWACEKCNKKFSRRHLLLDHVCQAENGDEIVDNHECEICKQCFRSLKYLYRHMAMHTDIFKCQGCDKTFSRKDSLQRHVLRCRPDLADQYKIYDCKNCKKTFATKLGLENHYLNCANYSCEKCRVAFFKIEHLEKHVCEGTVVHDGASVQFPCQECGKTFASINYLRRHEESHKGAFSCSRCDKSFSRKEEQKLHEHLCFAQHHLETNTEVECSICHSVFTEAKAYRDHHHEHSHPFKCEKCGKRFIKIGTLTTHTCQETVVDEDNPFSCDLCMKTFRTEKYLQRHQTIHEKPQFECEYCNKVFYRKDYLNNHVCKLPDGTTVRIVRKRDRIFIKENLVCHLCGRTFVSSSNLNKHMKIHGEKQNECPHCQKKFHYPAYLREHIKTVHQRAYQFQCADCGKILHSKTGLAAHLKQFHSRQIQLYQCGTCQKTFRQKGNLKTHMYSHTKEKTFMCDFCHKMFKYPDQLNRHRLEHTMTNKLNCEFCDKKFCRPYQLKKHVQTFHSGVVYVCDICNERCSHKHTIVRHYKRKHPEISSVFDHQPDFLTQLQQEHADNEGQVDIKPNIASIVQAIDHVETTVVTTEGADGEQQYTVAEIQTDGDGYLPQVAAEALQNLSNTIIASEGEGGTLTIPHSIEGPDGQQTVVILQIVNPGEEETSIQEIQEIQEVQEIQEIQ